MPAAPPSLPPMEHPHGSAQLDRIEAKLDHLLEALAGEEEEQGLAFTLDGEPVLDERDQSHPL